MPELFGLDIAGIVGDALDSAGGLPQGEISRSVDSRDPENPGRFTKSVITHSFKGFAEDRPDLLDGTLIIKGGRFISIQGNSLPDGFVPRPQDRLTFEGETSTIKEIKRDPASAIYECRVSG